MEIGRFHDGSSNLAGCADADCYHLHRDTDRSVVSLL